MQYNHNRPLSNFKEVIDKLTEKGFKPIAVTQIFFEDTFVFETEKEATNAFIALGGIVIGFFYSKDEFAETVKQYEKDFDCKVLVYNL